MRRSARTKGPRTGRASATAAVPTTEAMASPIATQHRPPEDPFTEPVM